MRFSIFGYVLVLAIVFAIPVTSQLPTPTPYDSSLYKNDFGSDFENELISVGSGVESIGK